MADWQTHGTKIVHKNNWYRVRQDEVTNPAGQRTTYSVVEPNNQSVYIIAVTPDHRFVLVNQFRYTIGRKSWEAVAGQCETGEAVSSAAARELLEEAALEAGKMRKIGEIQMATGCASGIFNVMLATRLSSTGEELDKVDGILEAHYFTKDEIEDMIMSGEIVCPHTIASFYIATNYLEKEKTNG